MPDDDGMDIAEPGDGDAVGDWHAAAAETPPAPEARTPVTRRGRKSGPDAAPWQGELDLAPLPEADGRRCQTGTGGGARIGGSGGCAGSGGRAGIGASGTEQTHGQTVRERSARETPKAGTGSDPSDWG